VRRGITPASDTFLLPVEFAKKIGPAGVNAEFGYQFVHNKPDGWLTGLVVGHDFTTKLEVGAEFSIPKALSTPPMSNPRLVWGRATRFTNP